MDIRAEIITIGDEILWGQITDTNSSYIASALTDTGIRTVHRTSVGDDAQAIREALQAAMGRAHVVLITGGLGPTKDDITKKTLADFFGVPLVEHPEAWADLQSYFTARGRAINPLNRLQATLPENAVYLKNEKGTAPGMWFEAPYDRVIISMPGVPAEMKHLIDERVIPRLQQRYRTPSIVHRFLQTIGIPESDLALKIEAWEDALPSHVRLAYLPTRGRVTLRLTGIGEDVEALGKQLDALADAAVPLIGSGLYSRQKEEIEPALARLLQANKLTLAAAESCTGGSFAARVTAYPGTSKHFLGSAVVYNEAAKAAIGVDPALIQEHGVVSKACAIAMAEAARSFFQADYAVSSTGIAGPAGPTDPVPVGTVHIACAGPAGTVHRELHLTPDRTLNIDLAVTNMLNLVRLTALQAITPPASAA